ncbi:S9 family peptidase [Flavitalea flava]
MNLFKMSLPIILFLMIAVNILRAQQTVLPPYLPGKSEIQERYRKAHALDSLALRTLFKTNVQAYWQPGGSAFWYRNILKDSIREYWYVDVVKGNRRKAFDEEKLAVSLQAVTGQHLQAGHLKIDSLVFSKDARIVSLKLDSNYWKCDLVNYTTEKIPALPKDSTRYPGFTRQWERWNSFSTDSLSPDKQWIAYVKEGNVFVRPNRSSGADRSSDTDRLIQFTRDADAVNPYGSLAWSPDSKYIVGYRIHPVEDSAVYYVLSSVAGTTRGQLKKHPYKQPGDPFTSFEMMVFTVNDGKAKKINTPIFDFFEAPELHWRGKDARYFLYEKVDRGHQRFRILEGDAQTGETRTIVEEQTNTFIYESRLFTHYLPATDEILMTSEKDGWRHIYRIDSRTGKEMQVTRGEWIVRDIDSIDHKRREIWFSASGRNAFEDPYFIHYYRIGFDGSHLLELTKAPGNHTVVFSPDKRYYTDTWSEVNKAPVTELHRTADAALIMELERADIAGYLAAGLRLPEPFHAKGRDGVTDIWGVVCRPADFDSTKRYPVIENIYAGPQDAFVPKNFGNRSFEMQSMAQLGFIVVQIDGMGTANRSKAFHDVCWKNLADAGFPDRILWIKALAARYPYVDASRVGLFGTSAGGQNALGGLLFHGDFYTAGVSSCGCHDNRVDKQWWNEQWMGYPVSKQYEEQSNVTNAAKLKGDLLLIVGEADTNVPPESTYRVADALIKAGKIFDFLPLPGMDHTDGGPYGRIKKRDFFVKHLLEVDPPRRNDRDL